LLSEELIPMRILIVEDEQALRESLVTQLSAAGYTVDAAADGEEGLYAGKEYPIDLAIIDLGLPKLPGIELIRKLREGGRSFPVLILTARDRWQDKVEGLQSGSDDYLAKPFHMQELLARVQALLRRSGGWSQPVLQCGDISLDTRTQMVTVGENVIDLTSFEYRILEFLMLRAGEVISKAELTERLYAQDFERDSNVIEVFIGRLRRKLDPEGSRQPIETLRGRGYRLALARAETPSARADGG
jgi:two-component system response regulator PhoP